MGVKIREKVKGSGVWWVFINHHGKRKAKKIGTKKLAKEVAKNLEAKLTLREFRIEQVGQRSPCFREYAEMWLALPSFLRRIQSKAVAISCESFRKE